MTARPSNRPLTADEDALQALNNIVDASRRRPEADVATPSAEAIEAARLSLIQGGLLEANERDAFFALHYAYAVDEPALTAAARTDERERIATTIEATEHPHDVFLDDGVGTWVKARRVFAAIARATGEPR